MKFSGASKFPVHSLFFGVIDFPTYHAGELGQPSFAHSLSFFSPHLLLYPPVQEKTNINVTI